MWGETLANRLSLWAFEAEAFLRMSGSPALTYPLSKFVDSSAETRACAALRLPAPWWRPWNVVVTALRD
jgi:hypothetical protein